MCFRFLSKVLMLIIPQTVFVHTNRLYSYEYMYICVKKITFLPEVKPLFVLFTKTLCFDLLDVL